MELYAGSWRLLHVDGGRWRFMLVVGDCGRLLQVDGGRWMQIETIAG